MSILPMRTVSFSGWLGPVLNFRDKRRLHQVAVSQDEVVLQVRRREEMMAGLLHKVYMDSAAGQIRGVDLLRLIDREFSHPRWKKRGFPAPGIASGEYLAAERFLNLTSPVPRSLLVKLVAAHMDLANAGLVESKHRFFHKHKSICIARLTPEGKTVLKNAKRLMKAYPPAADPSAQQAPAAAQDGNDCAPSTGLSIDEIYKQVK